MNNTGKLNHIGIYDDAQIAEMDKQEALSGEEVLACVVIGALAQDGFISKRMLRNFAAMHKAITDALNTALVTLDDESFADLHRP